jgi:glycosyltransferase involved in cell wall biosynthesis
MSGVDVVVPCYNYARFLPRCVSSILDQQDVNVRVLIIDDASSDDTPQVGQRLAELDPRVEFRRHDVNCGHIATYNEGLLGWASAKYSLLLSADDMLAPAALARATRLMDRHGDVGIWSRWRRSLRIVAKLGPT